MAGEFKIERASRKRVKLRIALQSPSGGGKTATSLLLAKGMVAALQARGELPKHLDECFIGVLDTERDSASLYSHLAVFDRLVLEPPYTVDRYLAALGELERVGYPVIIVDQISHEWNGKGGILEQVSNGKSHNDWANWNGPSQDHERFIDSLLASPAHLICTMRAKTAYVLEEKVNDRGQKKMTPTRVGMQAQQRAGTEFEFTTVLDLTVGTNAVRCVKDRSELFVVGETIPRLTPEWGVRLIDWVYTAKAADAMPAGPTPAMQAEAICLAGCRAIERAGTLPDLERVFVEQQRLLRACSVAAGREVVVPLLERLVAAKDARKGQFGPERRVAPSAELISVDDVANLELLLFDAKVPPEELKERFAIARLSLLPLEEWKIAQRWVISRSAVAPESLQVFEHVPPREEPKGPPTAPEQLNALIGEIASKRDAESGSRSFFDGMEDDIPPGFYDGDTAVGARRP